MPDLFQVARDCEAFGAQGITVHPRPDQRHIRYSDVAPLKELVTTEFNIEGFPSPDFIDLVLENSPHQVTLVPDPPETLTSDTGWDTRAHEAFLSKVVTEFKKEGIRVSLFVDPEVSMVEGAAKVGADRIELYTGDYAKNFHENDEAQFLPYIKAAEKAIDLGLGVNAGHDLNLDNLRPFKLALPRLEEVSIGHALITDSLYYGLQNTIEMYLYRLRPTE